LLENGNVNCKLAHAFLHNLVTTAISTDDDVVATGNRMRRAVVLTAFLAGTAAAAWSLVQVHFNYGGRLLGWSVRPGWYVVEALVLVSCCQFMIVRKPWHVVASAAFVCAALTVQYWGFSRIVAGMTGISFVLFGEWIVMSVEKRLLWKLGFALIAAYVQAVHMYNFHAPGQFMGFFGRGWTF
jgi:hypothetical protein